MRIRSVVLVAVLVPSTLAAQKRAKTTPSRTPEPKTTTASITAADLALRLHAFADDTARGREAGTWGHMMATDYIAKELAKLGLRPAGDVGTYFQEVPLISRTFSNNTSITVDKRTLTGFTDVVALPSRATAPRAVDGARAVYGGRWGDTTQTLADSDARGRLVLFDAPGIIGPRVADSPLQQAAGIALITEDLTSAHIAVGRAASWTLNAPRGSATAPVTLIVTRSAAETMLGGPVSAMKVGTMGHQLTGNLVYSETDASTRNVVAMMPGSDATLRSEYVAIGAHSDHDRRRAGTTMDRESYSDVNDDGAGVVIALEVAEAFAKARVKPKRSILFVFHTAGERQLLGSRYFTDHLPVPRDAIVAELDIGGGADERQCRGDHANYARLGIPVLYMTTRVRADSAMMASDTLSIDYPGVTRAAESVFAVAGRLAELDRKLVVGMPGVVRGCEARR